MPIDELRGNEGEWKRRAQGQVWTLDIQKINPPTPSKTGQPMNLRMWDERYRLESVKSAQSVDVSFEYDVLGRKVARGAWIETKLAL